MRTQVITLLALVLVVAVQIGDPAFLSFGDIANMVSQWTPAGLMAISMTFVIIAGGFDLSLSAGFSFCAVVAAVVAQDHSVGVSFAAAIVAGAFIGAINATLIARFDVNPFIATVGTGFGVTRVAFLVTGNAAFIVDDPSFAVLGSERILNFPYSGIIFIVALMLAAVVLSKSIYGHRLYAVSGNPEASRLSGLRVPLVLGSTYTDPH